METFSCHVPWEAGLTTDGVPAHADKINKDHFLSGHHPRRAVHWVSWDYYVISCWNGCIYLDLLAE